MTTTMPYYTAGKFGSGPAPEDWDRSGNAGPAGYTLSDTLGVSPLPAIAVYTQDDPEQTGPDWLLATCPDGTSTSWTGVASSRDAMDLLARWAPVAVASVLSYLSDILADPAGISGFIPRLIGRIRADETEGLFDRAEDEILAARREQRKAWMAAQASPEPGPAQGANGAVPAEAPEPQPESETAG